MKNPIPLTIITLLLAASSLPAATHYVSVGSTNPTPPYTNWVTAATNIQDAVNTASAGDDILVSDGVYQTGVTTVHGMRNRVAVTKPMAVRSVNGPAMTVIVGDPNRSSAMRCVYLTNGAVLAGFTLTNGSTQDFGDSSRNQSGGGVWCESSSAVVTNCVLSGNSAYNSGGGAYSGTLDNCTLSGNSGPYGGGATDCTLSNCTLSGNSALYGGGGAASCTLNNCTLTGNSASNGGGATGCTLYNCIHLFQHGYEGGEFRLLQHLKILLHDAPPNQWGRQHRLRPATGQRQPPQR